MFYMVQSFALAGWGGFPAQEVNGCLSRKPCPSAVLPKQRQKGMNYSNLHTDSTPSPSTLLKHRYGSLQSPPPQTDTQGDIQSQIPRISLFPLRTWNWNWTYAKVLKDLTTARRSLYFLVFMMCSDIKPRMYFCIINYLFCFLPIRHVQFPLLT